MKNKSRSFEITITIMIMIAVTFGPFTCLYISPLEVCHPDSTSENTYHSQIKELA